MKIAFAGCALSSHVALAVAVVAATRMGASRAAKQGRGKGRTTRPRALHPTEPATAARHGIDRGR